MLSNKVRVALRILIIIALLFGFAVAGVYIGYNYVISQDKRFNTLKQDIEDGKYDVKADTEGAVTIVVRSGDSTSDIAEQLYDQGLITNKFLFSIISKLNGFDGAYVAGTHYLLKGYSYDEIMYFLTLEPAAVKVTIPEGSTYYEIKKILHDAGLNFDDEEFDKCMNSPNLFVDYEFVSQIEIKDGRDFILSGYLYPDTYYFDINASPESIIRRFLNNMRNKLYDEYYTRAKKLGMSMDEVITLASVIQMETGKPLDMLYVSAVFHNRLKSDDESMRYLGSSATINYLVEINGGRSSILHTDSQLSIDSPYNTYTHQGLPPGPICMPGSDAISAALYPEPNCNYMYFCATGEDGNTAFATNLSDHEANIEKYRENWIKADEAANATPTPTPADYTEPTETTDNGGLVIIPGT
ncbi:MAG: endolytic transglycosylase MltG [Saccharofermentans sp.]|nr:endolytic transglycosylase MltG [Saccharofermentans sp.]